MSAEDAKIALKACEDGIALLTAQQKANQALVDDYNKRSLDVVNKRSTYNTAKTEFEKKLAEWTSKTGAYSNFKKYDGKNNQFWANETDGTCWWGENWDKAHEWCHNKANEKGYDGENYWAKQWGGCYGRHGNFLCKKTDDVVNNQIYEYDKNKPVFTEQWPPDAAPISQNLTSMNITCCANVLNVVGSEVTDSNIQQLNDCAKDLKAKAAGTPPPPPAGTPPPPPAGTPAGTSKVVKSTSTPVSSAKPNRRMLMVIVLVIISLILSSCSSGLFLLI